MGLNQVGVSGALNRARFEIAMRQNGIARIRFEWSPGAAAARDSFTVPILSAALRNHQIVITVDLVEMGTLGAASARAVPKRFDI